MKSSIIIILYVIILSCTSTNNDKKNTLNLDMNFKKDEAYNYKFDSLTNSKVSKFLIRDLDKKDLKKNGKKYVYKFANSQDLNSEFSTDEIFLPYYLGLINEEELFNILNNLPEKNWIYLIDGLQEYAVPNIKDKRKLFNLLNQKIEDRFKLETENLILATQLYDDKKQLKELIQRITVSDNSKFLYGESGKLELLEKVAYRYAYENIDEFSIELLNKIIDEHKKSNSSYRPAYFHPNPLHYFLYSEPKYCETMFSYILENGSEKITNILEPHVLTQEQSCVYDKHDFKEIDGIINSAHKHGLTSFRISNRDKLFLTNQKSNYGGEIPKLKVVYYSNLGIPFSESNHSLYPAVQITSLLYKNHLPEYIQHVQFIYYKNKLLLIIDDTKSNNYMFDISQIDNVGSPNNSLTDIFNYVLDKQMTRIRLVSLESRGFECLILAEPNKTRSFSEEHEINLMADWYMANY